MMSLNMMTVPRRFLRKCTVATGSAMFSDVGLSYIRLGQPSTELSKRRWQRIKLATELSKRGTGKTIYILDEPTTGLHFADVHRLIEILRRLSDGGYRGCH